MTRRVDDRMSQLQWFNIYELNALTRRVDESKGKWFTHETRTDAET